MIIYLAGLNGRKEMLWEEIMNIFLAGGIGANLKPLFQEWITKTKSKEEFWHQMDLYLAESGGIWKAYFKDNNFNGVKILESFYYADEWTERLLPMFGEFLLDSGAYTFMANKKGEINWLDYIEKYAAFINKNDIDHFFELDIDSIVGYEKVLEYRKILERKTGKKCIPVWHKSRGKEEYIKMCKEYDYVALGGIVTKEITKDDYKYFPWFINTAHKYGAKIHGLGFTNLKGLEKYHFDSVDSTSWTTGNRFGAVYKFNGRTMEKVGKKEGQRLGDSRAVAVHNFNEWVKFQKYAEKHL